MTTDERWPIVAGSIRREGPDTIFTLVGPTGRGQRVTVSTARLAKKPDLYKRTLDFLARDVAVMQ